MNIPLRKPTLRLLDYYIVEGINALACAVFMLCMYFWTKAQYDYSNTENLALGAVQGISHIIGARVGGRLSDRWGYNRLLIAGFSLSALVAAVSWVPEWRSMPFLTILIYSAATGSTWPALEGGAMHLPGKLNMPQRLGIYNLVWSISAAIGFAFSGFIFAWNMNAIFWIPCGLHLFQLAWVYYQRGRHTITGSTAMSFPHIGDHHPHSVKQYLMKLSWLSNSLGYFLIGGFAALTPHIGVRLGLSQSWTIWLGSSLLAARAIGFAVLYRWDGWHYHRGWGLYALWSAPLLLAVIFFTYSIWLVAISCMLFGFSLGLSYYMSIYYSLDASDNKGEQGGLHESIIGLGILLGPLVGAVGGYISGTTFGAKNTIIIVAFAITAIGHAALTSRNSNR